MAPVRPLKLKAEVVPARRGNTDADDNAVRVWVDSGIFHLDSEFDYAIPQVLDDEISVGVRIVVPFGTRECEAIVLKRFHSNAIKSLKQITKVISSLPVAHEESLELIREVAKRWAAHPFDVIRSAIPPRVVSVEKEQFFRDTKLVNLARNREIKPIRAYYQLPAAQDPDKLISDYLAKRNLDKGSVLVLVPEGRLLRRLSRSFPDAILLDSHLEKSERYRNYLRILQARNALVIGTRGSVFAPLLDLCEIVIIHESSENLYEPRTPGWNARDVAIVRSSRMGISLTFLGYSPSTETARLIEKGWIKFHSVKGSIRVKDFSIQSGELLPQGIFPPIREALKKGPVLFLAPRKGYSQALLCLECRNLALCTCGGKLRQSSKNADFECAVCRKSIPEWRCSWCHSKKSLLLGRGADRFAHEIGKAFPGQTIFQSSGDRIFDRFHEPSGIVIATPGALPIATSGYSAIVVLECDRFFTQIDMRAEERARELVFAAAGLLAVQGQLLLVISRNHPVTSAVAAWKPSLITRKELSQKEEIGFPPFARALTIDVENSEATSLSRALRSAQESRRLPKSTRILGPAEISTGRSRLLLLSSLEEGDLLVSLIHEFQRKRSVSKKDLAQIRIDPYSLIS